MEFKTWVREVDESGNVPDLKSKSESIKQFEDHKERSEIDRVSITEVNYSVITKIQELDSLVEELGKGDQFCINIEAQGTHFLDMQIIGICLSLEPGNASYIPIGHCYENCPKQIELQVVLERLCPFFENEAI